MEVETAYPLSAGQRWLLHLWEEAPQLARPVQRVYRLADGFDSAAFLEAVSLLVSVHEALRMRLTPQEEGFGQYFPDTEAAVSGEAISGRTPETRAAYVRMLIAGEAERVMDLREESPVRAKLIRVDGENLLSLCIDHIAADETAFDLFELGLQAIYEAIVQDNPVFKESSAGFKAYLSRELDRGNTEPASLIYWQQELSGVPLLAGNDEAFAWAPAAQCSFDLEGSYLQSLSEHCLRYRCSLFHAMIAVQLIIMSSTASLDDLVLNIPVSNRSRPQDRMIIANLSMLLHVRFKGIGLHQGPQLLIWVRDKFLKAMAHRQYDYPSLSHFMAGQAAESGGRVNWVNGCNFIVENEPLLYPNKLFAERLDNQPGRKYDIPATSFSLAARQCKGKLQVQLEWDEVAWPVSANEMKATFYGALDKLGLPDNSKKHS
jgi:hypothetical protein